MELIDLAQGMDRWRAVVIAAVNIRGIAGLADETIASPGLQPWVNQLDYIYIYIYVYLFYLDLGPTR